MIGVVDYEAGNISSISNALSRIGAEFIVSGEVAPLSRCDGIILPGVGAAPGAMVSLQKRGLTEFLSTFRNPLLGICLGMQLLYQESEEGPTTCLGVLPGVVRKFNGSTSKIPHMGWNVVERTSEIALMQGIDRREYFYFAHSYYAEVDASSVAATKEGVLFAAVIAKENYFGVQFHPEKSGN
ncbi:MAG: imidazole glycerol phosphate synthase subunit HisH, partial [Ignavibacteriales bacterium]|nr:imidazole glycerol phosphate synthase subunit HisH [Ignavibacteriales bacterium]